MFKNIFRFFLFTAICVFILSCSGQDNAPSVVSEKNTSQAVKAKAGDFAPLQLEAHYLKHGPEFGDITKEQYLESAQALLNASPSENILEKVRSNGDILHYRVSTGEFAVMACDGRIRTYFKADYRYWMRQ